MTAEQYFQKFNTENQDATPPFRVYKLLQEMVIEVREIASSKGLLYDSQIRPIFLLQEKKSKELIEMINTQTDFGKENQIQEDSFQRVINAQTPDLYNLVWLNVYVKKG